MTGIARKILIFSTIDGLILQPLTLAQRQRTSAVKISYTDNSILPAPNKTDVGSDVPRFEAFGIIGLLTVSSSSFLISITKRKQVAQVFGHPIYVVTEIAITPLSSKKEAETSISQTQKALRTRTNDTDGTEDDCDDSGDEYGGNASGTDPGTDDVEDHSRISTDSEANNPQHVRKTSIAEDVIAKKGGYGRFAKNWFSKEKWRVDQLRNLGLSATESDSESDSAPKTTFSPANQKSETEKTPARDVAANLLPKLLKTTQILFGSSRSYFFSYDYDITQSLASRLGRSKDLPLHTEVDPLFFWNKNLMQPFITAHQDILVLPLMQGFVGQRNFVVDKSSEVATNSVNGVESMEMEDLSPSVSPSKEGADFQLPPEKASTGRTFLLTLISRRSVKRAGLRYLRRGIDDGGNTANSVETEQILSDPAWGTKTYSLVQIRGSIPIFFTQSPYSFKPVPQIQHSSETNFTAFQKHFRQLTERYGNIAISSLVEKHGNEAIVGSEYEKHLTRLNDAGGIDGSKITPNFWDFHAETRGMKYESLATLMDVLGTTLDSFGYNIESSGKLEKKQSGVLRTNCMDCLDRTNVVQSAVARRALEMQLKCEGIDLSQAATQWFNVLWADNGDAISKQYASTAAMKGDFTRTRKRNYKGALTDMGLSISRFYSGVVNDFFLQTAIDFLVGNVTAVIFEEFEANMMSGDPAVSLAKMRQQAIDVSHKLVVENEGEEFLGGWALLFPREADTIKSMPFGEGVLLLTDAALYACRFDWNLEKVSSFERVELNHITNIKYGAFVISTLSASQANEAKNVGFVVTYTAGENDITRVNTRSLSTSGDKSESVSGDSAIPIPTIPSGLTGAPAAPSTRVLAAKALPSGSAIVEGQDTPCLSEIEQVKTVCGEIERIVLASRVVEVGTERKSIIEEKDIISLADARKSTGLIEQLGHSLKKLVWA